MHSTKSAASWKTTIIIGSSEEGLKVTLPAPPVPVYEKATTEGEVIQAFWNDPEALLRANLPQTIDLSEVLGLFKNFEGTYSGIFPGTSAFTLANPVFNKNGDILFELRPHTQISASAPVITKAVARATAATTRDHRTYASAVRPRGHGEHRSLSRTSRLSLLAVVIAVLITLAFAVLQRVKNKLTGEHDDDKHAHHHGSAKPSNGTASPVAASVPPTPAVDSPAPLPAPPAAKGGKKDARPEKA